MQNQEQQLAEPQLNDSWKQWIAINLMVGDRPEHLVQILMQNGFPQEEAMKEVAWASQHPYIRAGQSLARQVEKRNWVLDCYRVLEQLSPNYRTVERREKLSREEFFENYYTKSRPVIITGAMENWKAMTLWTPDYLKEQAGDAMVEVQFNRTADQWYEINKDTHKKSIPFGEYVDMVFNGGETNDFYMTAYNSTQNSQSLKKLWDDIDGLPEYLHNDGSNQGFLWLGPKGTITPLHHDLTNNFMAQVSGRKRIRMIPANHLPYIYNFKHCFSLIDLDNVDYQRHPLFQNVDPLEVILEPGEILFLPVGCWHHVIGMDITITLSFTNFLAFNNFSSFYRTYDTI